MKYREEWKSKCRWEGDIYECPLCGSHVNSGSRSLSTIFCTNADCDSHDLKSLDYEKVEKVARGAIGDWNWQTWHWDEESQLPGLRVRVRQPGSPPYPQKEFLILENGEVWEMSA